MMLGRSRVACRESEDRMRSKYLGTVVLITGLAAAAGALAQDRGLWSVYDESLKGAKYIDLTHVIAPNIPVWHGFAPSRFERARSAADIEGLARKGDAFTYEKHGLSSSGMDGSPQAPSCSSAPTGPGNGRTRRLLRAGRFPACRSLR
jgi:hypothetical protein